MENSLSDLLRTFDFHFLVPELDEHQDPMSTRGTPVVISVTGWKIVRQAIAWEASLIAGLYILTYVAAIVATSKVLAVDNFESALVHLTISAFAIGALASMIAPCIFATYEVHYSIPLIPFFVLCSGYAMEAGLSWIKPK